MATLPALSLVIDRAEQAEVAAVGNEAEGHFEPALAMKDDPHSSGWVSPAWSPEGRSPTLGP